MTGFGVVGAMPSLTLSLSKGRGQCVRFILRQAQDEGGGVVRTVACPYRGVGPGPLFSARARDGPGRPTGLRRPCHAHWGIPALSQDLLTNMFNLPQP